MNTKEAIEFLNKIIIDRKSLVCSLREYNIRIDEVNDLLKRGKKYKQIYGELKQYCLILENQNILKELIRLEQKYFPLRKEVNNVN